MKVLYLAEPTFDHGRSEVFGALFSGSQFVSTVSAPGYHKLPKYFALWMLKRILKKHNIELVVFFADFGHALFKMHSNDIVRACQETKTPLVVGLHNHQLLLREKEKELLLAADGYVFLSERSFRFYQKAYGLRGDCCLLPSLWLPSKTWYEKIPQSSKISDLDGDVHVAMGGRFNTVTLCPFTNKRLVNPSRYDFVDLIRSFNKKNIHTHIYGRFQVIREPLTKPCASDLVQEKYQELVDKGGGYCHLEGTTSVYEEELSKYDFFILKGFLPGDPVLEFEQHNYQLRFNSALAAGLPIIAVKGTDAIVEEQIRLFGGGAVIENMSEIEKKVIQKSSEHVRNLPALIEHNTIENWLPTLRVFFEKIVAGHTER